MLHPCSCKSTECVLVVLRPVRMLLLLLLLLLLVLVLLVSPDKQLPPVLLPSCPEHLACWCLDL
jgi:hypothetical protein